jgi:membrane-associated phospholipid phosphatase
MLTQYNSGRQKILSIILGFDAVLVGFSLIDVGAHYFLDVVGGILLGTATSFVMISFQNKFEPLFSIADSVRKRIR